MIAALGPDLEREVRKLSAHLGRDPVAAIAFRDVVFSLAGDDAIHAPDAFAGIDHHAEARHLMPPSRK
jgi:hypothetical protein